MTPEEQEYWDERMKTLEILARIERETYHSRDDDDE